MSVVEEYGAFKNSPYGKIAKYFMLMSLYNIYIYILRMLRTCVIRATPVGTPIVNNYSRTSMARTPTARLPWLIRTHFWVPTKCSRQLKKTIFKEIFLFYREIVCCVYSLESPHRGDSNEYTKHTITV